MANDINVSFFKRNPILSVVIVVLLTAILGFSGVFNAVAGIAKILFLASIVFLGFLLFKKYGKNLKR